MLIEMQAGRPFSCSSILSGLQPEKPKLYQKTQVAVNQSIESTSVGMRGFSILDKRRFSCQKGQSKLLKAVWRSICRHHGIIPKLFQYKAPLLKAE